MSRHRYPGFTLIELLLVICIIAMLASLLFSVFSRAREKARQTVCLSNQMQLVATVLEYAQDYDEELPPAAAPWHAIAADTHILRCPTDAKPRNGSSYTYNGHLQDNGLGDIVDPVRTPCSADGFTITPDASTLGSLVMMSTSDLVFRHTYKCLASFMDGHVNFLTELDDTANSSASATSTTAPITVTSTPIWTDTGITVPAGATVTIYGAAGSWSWNTSVPGSWYGPAGTPTGNSSSFWLTTANFASLIGYIGPASTAINTLTQNTAGLFSVGASSVTQTVTTASHLWLGFNDDYNNNTPVSDNSGTVTVYVSVTE